MSAAVSSIQLHPSQGYAEAVDPGKKWSLTSRWTDDLCKETELFLETTELSKRMEGKPLGKQAKEIVAKAKAKMDQKDMVATFAVLDLFDRVVGLCSLDYAKDRSAIEISCRLQPNHQGKGIATWAMNLLLREYLPAIGKSSVTIRALVQPDHVAVTNLMWKKFGIKARIVPPYHSTYQYDITSKQFLQKQVVLARAAAEFASAAEAATSSARL